MGKKNFKGGLDSLLGETVLEETSSKPIKKVGRPKTNQKIITKTSQIGTKEGETRATFIMKESTLEKIKALAYWERLSLKEVVETVFTEYLTKYEKANGKIKKTKK